ncbi:MAG: hypothetical protein LBP75_04420 [Planctomycetota bacterium]|nr:hypothetical protein [Planctomycetota bacterium]
MYVSSSTAADCMSMLNQQSRTKNSQNSPTDYFSQMLANAAPVEELQPCWRDATGVSHNGIVIGEPRIPVDSGNYYEAAGYEVFRETVLNFQLPELPAEMYSIGNIGQRYLNTTGNAYLKELRIENALPILPANTAEAQQRFADAYNHFDVYAYNLFADKDIEVHLTMFPVSFADYDGSSAVFGNNYDFLKAVRGLSAEQRPAYLAVIRSEAAKEMNVMAEEMKLYGAIANLAATNEKFRRAYDENPQSAAKNFSNEISNAMDKVQLPQVYTLSNDDLAINPNGFLAPKRAVMAGK